MSAPLWQDSHGGLCSEPAYGPYGMGSAARSVPHVWRFHGYAPHEEGGQEIWYCERCRKIERRWRQTP